MRSCRAHIKGLRPGGSPGAGSYSWRRHRRLTLSASLSPFPAVYKRARSNFSGSTKTHGQTASPPRNLPACCALGPGSLLVSSLRFSENPPDSASTPFLRRSDPIGRCTPGFSFKCRCGSQLQPPQSLSQPQASPCCCRLRSTPGPPSPALGLRECGASCCVLGRAGFEGAGPLRTDGRTLPPHCTERPGAASQGSPPWRGRQAPRHP